MTAAALAGRTGTSEPHVREWLAAQAASDYVAYDADTNTFRLEPEQAMVFAQEGSPAFLAGFFEIAEAAFRATSRVDRGVPHRAWCRLARAPSLPVPRHRTVLPDRLSPPPCLPNGCRRSTAWWRSSSAAPRSPTSAAVTEPRPSSMAQAFPESTFVGFDYHLPSIELRAEAAEAAGVADRVTFEVAAAKDFPGQRLRSGRLLRLPARHGRPGRRGAACARSAAPDGTWLIVEPFAHDRLDGQPQSRRPHLLRGVDDDLHAGVAVAGGRAGARRAGRRAAAARRGRPAAASPASAARPRRRSTWCWRLVRS